jgi:hypothetical protein
MTPHRFSRPPRTLRKAKLDNLVLVPANLLPFKAHYQQLANQQPPGTTVVVLPEETHPQRQALETVVTTLQAKGRAVQTIKQGQERRQKAR